MCNVVHFLHPSLTGIFKVEPGSSPVKIPAQAVQEQRHGRNHTT